MAGVISFHAACRFFSQAVWDVGRLGLIAARFIIERLLDDGAPITVVADGTLFKRWGRKTFILSFRVSRDCDLRRPVVDSVIDGTLAA